MAFKYGCLTGETCMYRIFNDFLNDRDNYEKKVPLLVRGARQIGKSHCIREYGLSKFSNMVEVNLELTPSLIPIFDSLNPEEICRHLELLDPLNQRLVDGKSLLFIDEIQESASAILSLRAFKESRPGLEVVGAGSLLEFALSDQKLRSFPVGRIGFAWLHPMGFLEFLQAVGHESLVQLLRAITIQNLGDLPNIAKAVHEKLLKLIRDYFIVGGMPEVVESYCRSKSYTDARKVQTRLTQGFAADFVKYGTRYDHRKLQHLLASVPRQVGKKFKFSIVAPEARARDYHSPLEDLEKAGLVKLVRATSGNGVPLASEEREGAFKAIFLDIGLMTNTLGLNIAQTNGADFLFVNEGALAEQFVGQEIMAGTANDIFPQAHFWIREVVGSEAEVDYLIGVNGDVYPVEVKAGKTGTLKSLRLFMKEKNSKFGVRISQHELSFFDGVLTVPFYLCSQLSRLIGELSRTL